MRKEELDKLSHNLNDEIISKIKKWKGYIDNGHYASSKDVTDTYNSVFDGIRGKANLTNCAACIRGRINTLYQSLVEWEKYNESKVEENIPIAGTTETQIVVEEPKPKRQTKVKKDGKD